MSELPSVVQELLARAAAEADAGRIDDAIASYRSVLDAEPTLAGVHHNCGALLFARGDYEAAVRSFEEASKHRPAWTAPVLAAGQIHFHAGRYAEAQAAFERALALDTNSIEALGNLGLTLQRRNRWNAALPYLQRARALAPTDTRAWFALRTSLLLLGRVAEAVDDFLRFEPGAPLSAELVTTGLMFSRYLGDPAYEKKYLPLALEWPYRPDQADLAAVTVSRAQYCDLPRETLLELYHKYDSLQQLNRSAFEPIAVTRRAAGRPHAHRLSLRRFPRARHGAADARGARRARHDAGQPVSLLPGAGAERGLADGRISRPLRALREFRGSRRSRRGARHRSATRSTCWSTSWATRRFRGQAFCCGNPRPWS